MTEDRGLLLYPGDETGFENLKVAKRPARQIARRNGVIAEPAYQVGQDIGRPGRSRIRPGVMRAPVADMNAVEITDRLGEWDIDRHDPLTGLRQMLPERRERQPLGGHPGAPAVRPGNDLQRREHAMGSRRRAGDERWPNRTL